MLSLHSILPKPSSLLLLLLPRRRPSTLFSVSASSDPIPPSSQKPQPKTSSSSNNSKSSELPREKTNSESFPATIPKKPRRGRRSEAAAVEDFVRDSLEKTFASIRADNSDVLAGKGEIFKDNEVEDEGNDGEEEVGDVGRRRRQVVEEEEDPDWPVDSDVGWGVRASEYFEKHPIRNVVEDGMEINWEEEMDDSWVKEINCLEWESFAFHPSPLIVLVFERYNRAADNWKVLKELEAATKVYWGAKDLLPPRTVKIDINIEKDLAYALKVKECPQVLFLKGNKILYREKDFRTADELVKMIAHFYYNAKKPSWIDDAALAPRY